MALMLDEGISKVEIPMEDAGNGNALHAAVSNLKCSFDTEIVNFLAS